MNMALTTQLSRFKTPNRVIIIRVLFKYIKYKR